MLILSSSEVVESAVCTISTALENIDNNVANS